jgi:hypothetical protein
VSAWDLVLTDEQQAAAQAHLFPGDGYEAAAILLCRPAMPATGRLMTVEVLPVPHEACRHRSETRLIWPGEALSEAADRAEAADLSVVLLHSHPGGMLAFSRVDDDSDQVAIRALIDGWSGPVPVAGHGTAVMVPSGAMIGRMYGADLTAEPIRKVVVAGEDLRFQFHGDPDQGAPMAFGAGMTQLLSRLHACVVGVSGTGSILAEQAARMGFGAVTLIDFDHVEAKNLNRILNSTLEDAEAKRLKVEMFSRAIKAYRPDAIVIAEPRTIASRGGVLAAASADILFCCVDSAEGRYVTDVVGQAFMIPVIDMGVTIPTRRRPDGQAAIVEVSGRVDFVRPGGPTLGDRGVYTPESLAAEYLARSAPEAFAAQRAEGYIKGAPEEAPSVIALNMRAASAAMLEFVARICPFRHEPNADHGRSSFALADGDTDIVPASELTRGGFIGVGSGLGEPLLAGYMSQSGGEAAA